jgi:hypothetical protein
LIDEAESESSEREEEDDDSRPARTVKNKPVPRKPGLPRESGQNGSRSSGSISRSASPSRTRKQSRNGSPIWPPEDDERLRE